MATARQPQTHALPEIVELSDDEARELFDRRARQTLGMSGDEFLRRWDAGEIADPDRTEIVELVLLIPLLGRPIALSRDE
jgi:hypothetical protein